MNNQRLGMTFSTSENSHYYYDAGTGKVVSCDLNELEIINNILENKITIEEIRKTNTSFAHMMDKENLFQALEYRDFLIPSEEELKDLMMSSCEQLIIELTEACNLRCGYCIYNEHHPEFRGFCNRNMEFSVARESIDYILKEYQRDRFALTFYGGEPLINFELMKKCIDYTRDRYPNIKLEVAFTTNLTLLTEEMVEYFNTLDSVYILCSVDGPQEFHDKYRKYINKKGSHADAIRGLKLLLEKFYDKNNPGRDLAINCVVIPPYSKKDLEQLNSYFYDELKLPQDITCRFSYLDRGEMEIDLENGIISDDIERKLEASPIEEWAIDSLIEDNKKEELFRQVSQDMLRIAKRIKVQNGVISSTYLHGNCVPGQRRVYVTVDGKFKTCERVGDVPELGDYKEGYNFEKIYKNYYTDYINYFKEICKDCWAQAMCSICYERTMGKNGIKPFVEKTACNSSKRVIKDAFINYYRMFEKDRNYLQDIIQQYEKIQEEEEGIKQYEI